jgi:hypothetical protein
MSRALDRAAQYRVRAQEARAQAEKLQGATRAMYLRVAEEQEQLARVFEDAATAGA